VKQREENIVAAHKQSSLSLGGEFSKLSVVSI
jgi:hypothetical protein